MTRPLAQTDQVHMRRAIALAMRGRGRVEPNPMVGCVIVRDGRVIGEGHHEQFGGPHAERQALAACAEPPRGATVYVTLEPCCHTNKKTPPCTAALIEAQVGRVVAGCADPNPQVSGGGLAALARAGIDAGAGVLEASCRQLIAAHVAGMVHRRPYVTLKWAQSADGKVAGPGGQRMRISGDAAYRAVHELRARCDVIMVGVGTILADDPQLTARTQGFRRPLTRVVLDSHLRTPPDGAFARSAEQISTIIVCGRTADREKAQALRNRGIVIYEIEDPHSGVGEALRMLHERLNAAHVLVEPGPTLGRSMLSGKLVDRVWVIRSPNRVDAASAPDAPAVPSHFVQTGQAQLDRDVLSEYLNPRSDVFFAADQSADFLMASGAMSTATDAPIAPR